ncbi:ROK family protein [Geopsychrobacter electrodiphilus]|uniref:ROK family protein n=1 Tax=Geopsychrobacter electrodiphilus TaxID=225196 RepID=UPI00037CCBC0|nr:ROK family protein [Geopsychrobacter electrodiphilus]
MNAKNCTIGVDLGGTKIKVALVTESGSILNKLKVATPAQDGPTAVIRKIVTAVHDLLQEEGISPHCLGIGVAGQIDSAGKTVRFAPNLNWHEVPLQAELQRELKLPVALLNDVRAATWGEWLFGAGKGCADMVCLFVGTGIGGSVVSGGRMLDGSSNSAGELGHMTVDLHGPLCNCGNRGCLEALAGGWAIARSAREAVTADPTGGALLKKMAEGSVAAITAALVARAAQSGDPLAGQIVARVSEALISGMVGLINAFNPERLVLGGGVIEGLPKLVGEVERGVKGKALQAALAQLQVLPALLHNDAGVIGAAAFAMQRCGTNKNPG